MSLCRYNEMLFIIDTCQGASMYERFYSPNIMALASSQVGEDSLSVSYFMPHIVELNTPTDFVRFSTPSIFLFYLIRKKKI